MANSSKNIQAFKELMNQEGLEVEKYFPPCRGCGYCCFQSTCMLGLRLLGDKYPCLALKWNGERYICEFAEEYRDELYIGCGCCSPLNTWRQDVKERGIREWPR